MQYAISSYNIFVSIDALRPNQRFYSFIKTLLFVEPVLSNENDVSYSRGQQCAKNGTRNLLVPRLAICIL